MLRFVQTVFLKTSHEALHHKVLRRSALRKSSGNLTSSSLLHSGFSSNREQEIWPRASSNASTTYMGPALCKMLGPYKIMGLWSYGPINGPLPFPFLCTKGRSVSPTTRAEALYTPIGCNYTVREAETWDLNSDFIDGIAAAGY